MIAPSAARAPRRRLRCPIMCSSSGWSVICCDGGPLGAVPRAGNDLISIVHRYGDGMVPDVVLGDRYAEAVRYASAVHADQVRKGTTLPYTAHLLGVSSLVLEAGGDEDQAIAALLHDSAEDHGGEARLEDIERAFGPRVAAIVRECSDSLTPEGAPKADWETRKHGHLRALADASSDGLLVWAADKVHNGRAIVTDLRINGPDAMARFSAPADKVLWYYRENLRLLRDRGVAPALVVPLTEVLQRMEELLVGGDQPLR